MVERVPNINTGMDKIYFCMWNVLKFDPHHAQRRAICAEIVCWLGLMAMSR